MNKGEFVDHIAQEYNCTKAEAEKITNAFTKSVTSALKDGAEITLIGFGKFSISQIPARQGRNPQTGEVLNIAAYVQPKFSAGKELKDACNGRTDNKSDKNNKSSNKAKDKDTTSKKTTTSKNDNQKQDTNKQLTDKTNDSRTKK